jgi:hypothetical protein
MDCPDCGATPGDWHKAGCSWAQCPYCGDHLVGCGHGPPRDDQLPWTGYDFWLDACLELGLFRRRTQDAWVPCRADDPGSLPDVRRLWRDFRWGRAEKQFVARDGSRSGGRSGTFHAADGLPHKTIDDAESPGPSPPCDPR